MSNKTYASKQTGQKQHTCNSPKTTLKTDTHGPKILCDKFILLITAKQNKGRGYLKMEPVTVKANYHSAILGRSRDLQSR